MIVVESWVWRKKPTGVAVDTYCTVGPYFTDICDRLYVIVCYCRNRDDVDATLAYAKLDVAEMRPLAQCLVMSQNLDNESVKLLEMDNNVLDSLLTGNRYCFDSS